jgi:hypothetical protein
VVRFVSHYFDSVSTTSRFSVVPPISSAASTMLQTFLPPVVTIYSVT